MERNVAQSSGKGNFVTSKLERMSYGGYFVGQNIMFMLVLQYLMLFYTDVAGITAAAVGTMFLIARVWDAINDPIMGVIVDKRNSPKGKFKPWINMVVVVLPIMTALLFVNLDVSPAMKLAYAYITYIAWGMLYTVSDVPIFALATVMTDNLNERVSLMSIGRLAAGVASMITAIFAMPLILSMGWTKTAFVLAGIALVTMLPIRFFAKERVQYERKETMTLKSTFKYIKSNKYLLVFYSAFLAAALTNTVTVAQNYFAIYNLGNAALIPVIAMGGMLPMLILPIFLPVLIRKIGKRKIMQYGTLSGIVASLAMYFIGYNSLPILMALVVLRGFGMYLPMVMMGMVTADCIEYGAYKTGTRAEGISFSIQTFTTKLSLAISAFISGIILTAINYVPNAEQTIGALEGIWKMFALYPVIGYIAMYLIITFFYDLKESDVQEMVNEMSAQATKA